MNSFKQVKFFLRRITLANSKGVKYTRNKTSKKVIADDKDTVFKLINSFGFYKWNIGFGESHLFPSAVSTILQEEGAILPSA